MYCMVNQHFDLGQATGLQIMSDLMYGQATMSYPGVLFSIY